VITWAVGDLAPAFALLRAVKPVFFFKRRWVVVTRYDHVREVLSNDPVFPTPFGPKMRRLTRPLNRRFGTGFMLGMTDNPQYQQDRAKLTGLLRREDLEARLKPLVQGEAERIVAGGGGRLDVVRDLFRYVPSRVVEDYFGVRLADPHGFADHIMDVSRYTFADPCYKRQTRDVAFAAAVQIRAAIDAAFDAAEARPSGCDTLVERAVALQGSRGPGPERDALIGMFMGTMTGFIPNLAMAATNVLLVLFKHPNELALARQAVIRDDDELLARYISEALRLKPVVSPGAFRVVKQDYVFGQGTRREIIVPRGSRMVVALPSALRDRRVVQHPGRFRLDRPAHLYDLQFGHGLHNCLGRMLTEAQLPLTLKPLLASPRLRRAPGPAGRLEMDGPYPRRMTVLY
jgi:cytochrome P450